MLLFCKLYFEFCFVIFIESRRPHPAFTFDDLNHTLFRPFLISFVRLYFLIILTQHPYLLFAFHLLEFEDCTFTRLKGSALSSCHDEPFAEKLGGVKVLLYLSFIAKTVSIHQLFKIGAILKFLATRYFHIILTPLIIFYV